MRVMLALCLLFFGFAFWVTQGIAAERGLLPAPAAVEKEEKEDPATKEINKKIEALQSSLSAENETGNPIVPPNIQGMIRNYLARVQKGVENGAYREARDQLDALLGNELPEETRKGIRDLSGLLDSVIKEQVEKLVQEGKAILSELSEICRTAESEDELDAVAERAVDFCGRISRQNSSASKPSLQSLATKFQNLPYILKQWALVIAARKDGDVARELELINQISQNSSDLMPASEIRKKQAELRAALDKQIESQMEEMKKALMTATNLEAVAQVAGRVQVLLQQVSRSSNDHPRRYLLDRASQSLSYWQGVIAAEDQHDYSGALQRLRNLENDSSGNGYFITVKDITAKKAMLMEKLLREEPKADDPLIAMIGARLDAIKGMDDLIALRSKLQDVAGNGLVNSRISQELQGLLGDLQMLEAASSACKQGKYADVFTARSSYGHYGHRWKEKVARFYQQLQVQAVQAVQAVYQIKDLILKPDGDGLDKVLLARADRAFEEKDWHTLYQVLDAYRMVVFSQHAPPEWLGAEMQGVKAYMTAEKYEASGQYELAVSSYLTVLNMVGSRVPTKEATARLKALKTEQPDAFKKGLTSTSAPLPAVRVALPVPSAVP